MRFLDDFYDVLFKPKVGLQRVSEKGNIWIGLAIYLVVTVISNLSSLNAVPSEQFAQEMGLLGLTISPVFFERFSRTIPLLNTVIVLSLGPIVFFARTAFLSLIAQLFGGEGKVRSLGAALGYAQLPTVLMAPFSVLNRIIPTDFMGIVSLAIFIWVIVLRIIAIRSTFEFTTGKSAIVLFVPFLVLITSLIFFLLFFGAFLTPFIMEFIA